MTKSPEPPGKDAPEASAVDQYVVKDPERFALNLARMIEEAGKAAAAWAEPREKGEVRDSVAECGPIANGDWIAITRDGIQVAVKSAVDAAVALVDVLVDDDAEIVTIIVGADADADDAAQLATHVVDAHPHVEVEVHRGDQPLYPYLIGVE